MVELNDQHLDRLLHEHFASRLDPQLGRATAAMQRSCAAVPGRRRCRSTWTAAAGLALAASLAAVFLGPGVFSTLLKPRLDQPAPAPPVALVQPDIQPVEHQIHWKDIDQGTVFVNGQVPMRSILRQRIDSLQWSDPADNAVYQMSLPQDEIVLIGLNPN
jgi:hypothetical protein